MRTYPSVLKVFISTGCRGCRRALELAAWAREAKPRLGVEVIDMLVEPDAGGDLVVGTPTYVYRDRAVFLGNPSWQELEQWLDQLDLEA